MTDSLRSASTPPHLRHHHRTLSSRVPHYSNPATKTSSTPNAIVMHSDDRREDDEGLMFQLDLEDDKLASDSASTSPKHHSPYTSWSHYTSRLPSHSVSAQPLRPTTSSPSLYRTLPLPLSSSPASTKSAHCGSAQQLHRASLSPTIPTLSSRMRSATVSTPTNRTAVPSPSARLIKALPLSPAASTTSDSSCASHCSSASDDDSLSPAYVLSPSSPPSPSSPIALLTASHTASLPKHARPHAHLPVQPALPRASTLPAPPSAATKAQQWRADKGMSVLAGESKRGSGVAGRMIEEAEIGTYIFELEL